MFHQVVCCVLHAYSAAAGRAFRLLKAKVEDERARPCIAVPLLLRCWFRLNDSIELSQVEEKIEAAVEEKAAGTVSFKAGDFESARDTYAKGLDWIETLNNETPQQKAQVGSGCEHSCRRNRQRCPAQVETLKISLLLNQCLMMQKLEQWGESIAPCNLVPSLSAHVWDPVS